MNIEILDLKINNLSSVFKSISRSILKEDSCISIDRALSSENPDLIVLPGLGHFASGMKSLRKTSLDKLLFDEAAKGTRIVGICLGMQLLCLQSEEAPGIEGLGLVNGTVSRLPSGEAIPHIGWTGLTTGLATNNFPSLESDRDFYFVHSYAVELVNRNQVLTYTNFSTNNFVSSYKADNYLGFQFHPEKSGNVGQELITEIIEWAR